jgi:hypothetical protein
LRRLLAIAILLLIGLPILSPLFALSATSEANLPMCCRRDGMHHCMLNMATQADPSGTTIGIFKERCPSYPHALSVTTHSPFTPDAAAAIFAALVAHPASVPQVQAKRRISFSRSRQKRGPPVSLL